MFLEMRSDACAQFARGGWGRAVGEPQLEAPGYPSSPLRSRPHRADGNCSDSGLQERS